MTPFRMSEASDVIFTTDFPQTITHNSVWLVSFNNSSELDGETLHFIFPPACILFVPIKDKNRVFYKSFLQVSDV